MTDITITPLNVGSLLFNLGAIYRLPKDHLEYGRSVHVPIIGYHIALPGRSVLVDAPAYEPEQVGRMLVPDFVAPPPMVEQLKSKGIDSEGVTDVIITHLHYDHFSGLTSFTDGRYVPNYPNARHYLGAGDWNPKDFEDLENRTIMVVQNEGLLDLVTEKQSLGDGLTIVPMPGETPGHQVLALDTGMRRNYFTGDLFHHEIEFTYPGLNVYWADKNMMPVSKANFLEEAASLEHHIYFAHIPGPYEVAANDNGHCWEPVSQK